MPRQTAVELSARTPRKARSVVVDVLGVAAGVAAGHLGVRPGAGQVGGHADLAAAPAEAERRPVERAVALHFASLGGEEPSLFREILGRDVVQVGGRADDQLDHGVEQGVGLVGGGAVVLPDLGLGALLEYDQGAPVDGGAVGIELEVDLDRLVALDVLRHVDEHAVVQVRLVAGDKGVIGGNQRTELFLEQLGMLGQRFVQWQHDHFLGPTADRHLGRQTLVGIEVEARDVGELPALGLRVG